MQQVSVAREEPHLKIAQTNTDPAAELDLAVEPWSLEDEPFHRCRKREQLGAALHSEKLPFDEPEGPCDRS